MARQASPGFIPDRGSYRANFSLPAGINVEVCKPNMVYTIDPCGKAVKPMRKLVSELSEEAA